jgi:hypothetical protein
LLAAFSFALAIPLSLLQFAFQLCALLVVAMEEEHSLILDVVGDLSKVPLAEITMTTSSSDGSSVGMTSDGAKAEAEDAIVMDPRESAEAMTSRLLPLLWAISGNWNLYDILPRVLRMSQWRR